MPNEEGCNVFGGGPEMEVHWKRLWWNVKHFLWDFKNHNPYHTEKDRLAISDIGHSMVNVSVEYCRACPYRAGHYLFWSNMAWLAVVAVVAATHIF